MNGFAVEEVLLSRDEMANLAWAVEEKAPGASGQPVDLHEVWQLSRTEPPIAQDVPHTPALSYKLVTEVPPYWLPLVNSPPTDGSGRSVALTLTGTHPPRGALTVPGMEVFEETLPRTGVRLRRLAKRTRSADGAVHLWMARRASTGVGESYSGLRFDEVEAH